MVNTERALLEHEIVALVRRYHTARREWEIEADHRFSHASPGVEEEQAMARNTEELVALRQQFCTPRERDVSWGNPPSFDEWSRVHVVSVKTSGQRAEVVTKESDPAFRMLGPDEYHYRLVRHEGRWLIDDRWVRHSDGEVIRNLA